MTRSIRYRLAWWLTILKTMTLLLAVALVALIPFRAITGKFAHP